jgi:hypothetical protein
VAIFSLLAAVWSVVVARGANRLSAASNVVAEKSNEIAREALRHSARGIELAETAEAERLRKEHARAKIAADLSPLFVSEQATTVCFRPRVRVSNVGERDSGLAIVRVYMATLGQSGDLMAWDDESGKPDRTRPMIDPEVVLRDLSSGKRLATQYLERVVDNITTTMPVEFRVLMPVPILPPGQGHYRFPVRVTVRAANADTPFEWTADIQSEYGPHAADSR